MANHPFTVRGDLALKLKRMSEITAAIRNQTEEEEATWDDELMRECRSLREELVTVFLPLIEKLVDAGLLTMSIDLTADPDITKYSAIAGEGVEAFDNGNIWIDCEASSWTFKPGAAPSVEGFLDPGESPRRPRCKT